MAASVEQLVSHYERILADRMTGLPFLNPMLDIEAVDFRDFDGHQVGVLITPWFMNLIVLPGNDEWDAIPQGELSQLVLPAGRMEFNVAHDENLGTLLSAVLFTTVADFPDALMARAVAAEIMNELFTDAEAPTMNRRDLFTRSA
ncbi:MAG: [NiFe]-hydrogenase assembly chaperone HybE [Woeseiaceae bacterium]|nr:[NiFe]-hydrogenase assembly chaperone HybE [Woeseiaceae bacterium]